MDALLAEAPPADGERHVVTVDAEHLGAASEQRLGVPAVPERRVDDPLRAPGRLKHRG
jgi:hypothetical protein